MNLSLPPLREVIARYGLAARKGLGQHFLLDPSLTRAIAAAAGPLEGCVVLEVGPGPGGLTRALLERDAIARVVAVEKDRRCVEALGPLVEAAEGRLTLLEGDALRQDALALTAPGPRAVVANLPYNVGTPLLIGWLRQMPAWESLTIMLQAEVAERLTAEPGDEGYGRLSVLAQAVCATRRVLRVPAGAFTPPPKVDSAVVRLVPRPARPTDVALPVLERVTAAAFGQRRKMLRASLKPLGGESLARAAGLDPSRRAETLSIAEFETLARIVAHGCPVPLNTSLP